MGDIIGGVIGGIGNLVGGSSGKSNALTGYNYLKSNPLMQQAQTTGSQALTNQSNVLGSMNGLLTGTATPAQNTAFKNYLNSTGYNFMLGQGQQALTGSAAARGLLNSGATAKALDQYGTNLGSTYFNNYLNQLGNLAGQFGSQAQSGLNAATNIGASGTQGGIQAANAMASGIGGAAGMFGSAAGSAVTPLTNFFGSI